MREPSNPDSNIQKRGYNNWQYSNMRQWLNKGDNWYTPSHQYDATPIRPDPNTVADGFLNCLPEDFLNIIIPIKNSTKGNTVTDGDTYYNTYDKFFPLSISQMNCKCTDNTMGTGDESEGRYWDYWRDITNSAVYLEGDNTGVGATNMSHNFDSRIMYTIENHSTACNCYLRSAFLSNTHQIWAVNNDGSISDFYCDLPSSNTVAITRTAPACVIG